MPSAGLCRLFIRYTGWRGSGHFLTRHNQRLSRNANSLSCGRYRLGLAPSGSVRESAFSFSRMSAWRYFKCAAAHLMYCVQWSVM